MIRYGRWIVISASSTDNRKTVCVCECGVQKEVDTRSLRDGRSSSCGCLRREFVAAKNFIHGESRNKEYRTWCHMLERCYNPNTEKYPLYGGRGIKVCDRWQGDVGFPHFLTDMGKAFSRLYSIERKDRNGDYTPDNCCWALPFEQSNNTSRNVFVSYNGENITISQIARNLGVNRRYLAKLIKQGVSLEEALQRVSRNTKSNYILTTKESL